MKIIQLRSENEHEPLVDICKICNFYAVNAILHLPKRIIAQYTCTRRMFLHYLWDECGRTNYIDISFLGSADTRGKIMLM